MKNEIVKILLALINSGFAAVCIFMALFFMGDPPADPDFLSTWEWTKAVVTQFGQIIGYGLIPLACAFVTNCFVVFVTGQKPIVKQAIYPTTIVFSALFLSALAGAIRLLIVKPPMY